MELYYRRSNGNLETVVYLLPDIWSALPTSSEWTRLKGIYRTALYGEEDKKTPPESTSAGRGGQSENPPVVKVVPAGESGVTESPTVSSMGGAEDGTGSEEPPMEVALSEDAAKEEDSSLQQMEVAVSMTC